MTYELHPLCTLFPRMTGDEFDALVKDIATNGLRQPIVKFGGMILDGGNRYRACIEAEVEPSFVEYDEGDPVSFVLSNNLLRRHLTPGQQAAIVSSAQNWATAQGRGGDRKSDQSAILPLDTVAGRAAQSGASARTQKMADKVVKADPELAKEVARGEKTLPEAIEQVTGKRPGTRQPAPETVEEHDYDPTAYQIEELSEAVRSLAAENEQLKDAIAVGQTPEIEGLSAAGIIAGLRERVSILEIELDGVKSSRDSYMRENGDMKIQLRRQRYQLKKLAGK